MIFTVGYRGTEHALKAKGESARLARRIYNASDDDGNVACHADFFPGHPELHTTMSLYRALLAAGCDEVDDAQ